MSTIGGSWSRPKIVNDGLVLYLDASAPNSYSPYFTPTTWKDLSGNGRNGTLTNGPTYSQLNGGSIVFDGVNDTVTIPVQSLGSNWSINTWVKSNQTSGGSAYLSLIGTGGGLNFFKFEWNNRILAGNSSGGSYAFQSGFTPGLPLTQTFFMLTVNVSSGTLNVYSNTTKTTVNTVVTGSMNIDRIMSSQNAYPPGGALGNFLLYNRALTDVEILQNYNATKGRYGL